MQLVRIRRAAGHWGHTRSMGRRLPNPVPHQQATLHRAMHDLQFLHLNQRERGALQDPLRSATGGFPTQRSFVR